MNVVLCPPFVFMGTLERVPGAKKVACMGCGAALTATPTSLQAAGVEGGFLCRECGEQVMLRGVPPVRRPDGAREELLAAGLRSIADDDEQVMRMINGKLGAN